MKELGKILWPFKDPQNFLRQTFVYIKALIMDYNPGPDLV